MVIRNSPLSIKWSFGTKTISSCISKQGCLAPTTLMFPVPVSSAPVSEHRIEMRSDSDLPFSNNFGRMYPSGEDDAITANDIETSIAAINPSSSSNNGQ
jgi:hypothetical protein